MALPKDLAAPRSLWGALAAALLCTSAAAWGSTIRLRGAELEFVPELDARQSVAANARSAFQQLVRHGGGLIGDLSPSEIAGYEARVIQRLELLAIDEGLDSLPRAVWGDTFRKVFKRSLADEEPAMTERDIAVINSKNVGWQARLTPKTSKLSVRDFEMLCGTTPVEEGEHGLEAGVLHLAVGKPLPQNFSSEETWPECAESFNHIRDQGKCGSCWAQAAAGALDGRICIATGGKWTGWVSAGYMTSCFAGGKLNGCVNGSPQAGFHMMNTKGVPTGGNHESGIGCVPYFTSKGALEHFGRGDSAPKCPTECSATGYPRNLDEDRLKGKSDSHFSTRSVERAKKELVSNGPIGMSFNVYSDFLAYGDGIYDPTSSRRIGHHSVQVVGYGVHNGTEFVRCMNSWGPHWGESGFFRVKLADHMMFYIGDVSDTQPPLPSGA